MLKPFQEKDQDFVYNLVEEWLKSHPEQTVIVTKLPPKKEFFAKPAIRYIIDEYKGFVQLFPNNEIGYYLKPQYQNQGIGTKAVKELIEIEPRSYYFVTVSNENPASIKLAKKIGFKPKGQILLFEKND